MFQRWMAWGRLPAMHIKGGDDSHVALQLQSGCVGNSAQSRNALSRYTKSPAQIQASGFAGITPCAYGRLTDLLMPRQLISTMITASGADRAHRVSKVNWLRDA